MPSLDYPAFDEAVQRLRSFLRSVGMDLPVQFIDESNLIVTQGLWCICTSDDDGSTRAAARERYESAVAARLGVSLNALCVTGGVVGVSVGAPADSDEAARLMYPDGLKLSVAEPLREVTALPPDEWLALRSRLQRDGERCGVVPELLK